MNTHVDKTQENQRQSVSAASSQLKNGCEPTFQFADNRLEAITQRKLQEVVNNSPQAKQAIQLQVMAGNNFPRQQQPLQKKENNTGLPDNLKSGIENLSGYSMDDVKVHRNSDKPAQLQAHAFAQGTDIHLASGQEKHLPHEAWHVVQQKQGRVKPILQMKGGVNVNDDMGLEKEADVMGAKSLQMMKSDKVTTGAISEKQRQVNPKQYLIQRYTTRSGGLSVAGELHTKSLEHRGVEASFTSHIKSVDTQSYWEENQMPVTVEEEPALSEHPDHFIAWDIDRMKHHYQLIKTVLEGLPMLSEQSVALDKIQAAQIALSASSMLETLDFLRSDLMDQDDTFVEVAVAHAQMNDEYSSIFNELLDNAKAGSLNPKLRMDFVAAKFPATIGIIDEQITALLPDLSATRQIASYDFTRTVAMNKLANEKKGIPGVWVIGEYHVQEIQEHLSDNVQYDLVSMNDFNADVKEFDETRGGSTIKVDYLGELLTLSRKLSANLNYFVGEIDKEQDMNARLAHWGRCMNVLRSLEALIRAGLADAKIAKKKLPEGVSLKDLQLLVEIILVGMDKERNETLSYDFENLPEDLYHLMRDPEVLKAAKDLNVLTGLAEFN
jgi:hypothetical protein